MWRGVSLLGPGPRLNFKHPRRPTTSQRLLHLFDATTRNTAEHDNMSQTQQVEHSDSISSQDPHNDIQKKTKSRRPPSEFATRRLRQRGRECRNALGIGCDGIYGEFFTDSRYRYCVPTAEIESMAVRGFPQSPRCVVESRNGAADGSTDPSLRPRPFYPYFSSSD